MGLIDGDAGLSSASSLLRKQPETMIIVKTPVM
jgi:hypothetical protein